MPWRPQPVASEPLAGLAPAARGSRLQASEHAQGRAAGMIQGLWQKLEEHLAQRHCLGRRCLVKAPSLHACESQKQKQIAACQHGMVVEVQDRARQLAVVPTILRRARDQATAQPPQVGAAAKSDDQATGPIMSLASKGPPGVRLALVRRYRPTLPYHQPRAPWRASGRPTKPWTISTAARASSAACNHHTLATPGAGSCEVGVVDVEHLVEAHL